MHCSSLATNHMASGFGDSSVRVWPLVPSDRATSRGSTHPSTVSPDDASRHSTMYGHRGPVYGMSFSTSGQYLVSGSEDCSVCLWDVHREESPGCIVRYKGHAYPVWDLAFRCVYVYMILEGREGGVQREV